jgi:hypothetical protein
MNAMTQRELSFQERIATNLQERGVEFDAGAPKTVEFSAENIEVPVEVVEE